MGNIVATKFSPGDRIYFPIYFTADILAAIVKDVFTDNGLIFYDIQETISLVEKHNLPEAELFTFSEAKGNLIAYLTAQLTKAQNITGI